MTLDIPLVYAGVLLSLVVLVPIKELKKEYAPIIISSISLILLKLVIKHSIPLFEYISNLGINSTENLFSVMYKCFGIALVTQLVSEICIDFGASGIAGKVELIGKIGIIITVLPLIESLLKLVEGLV